MKTLLLSTFLAATALAQDPVQRAIDNYAKVISNCPNDSCRDDAKDAAATILQRMAATTPVSVAAAPPREAVADANEGIRLAQRLLPDRQVGASPGAGGGTSLTSLASVSELISGAMESGAFQRDTAGTVTTLRINPAAAYHFFSGDCTTSDVTQCVSAQRSRWRGLSLMATYDTARSDQPAPGNAADPASSASAVLLRARRGLASAGVRYDFFKPANQKSKDFRTAWSDGVKALRPAAAEYAKAYAAEPAGLVMQGLADGLPGKLHELLRDLAPGERRAAAEKFHSAYIREKQIATAGEKWEAFQKARQDLIQKQLKLFKDTLDRRLFSIELVHQRPKDEPEYGSFTFIWGKAAGGDIPNWNFTANAGANFFYDKQKAQKDRLLRDFHISFQADRKLWKWKVLNQPTFTVAGYYQRLTDDAILTFNSDAIVPGTGIALPKPADVILKGTKGNVGIAQAKLTIPLKDSGVSFPMAVTWSNRTELLHLPGNDVRGQFGLQFEIDKLLTSFKSEVK